MRAEDPDKKIHACSTNASAKNKRFILQFPTVTLSSTRLWLSIAIHIHQGSSNFWERIT